MIGIFLAAALILVFAWLLSHASKTHAPRSGPGPYVDPLFPSSSNDSQPNPSPDGHHHHGHHSHHGGHHHHPDPGSYDNSAHSGHTSHDTGSHSSSDCGGHSGH